MNLFRYESVLNLETKGSYFNNNIQKDLPNICIIGLILLNDNFVLKILQ